MLKRPLLVIGLVFFLSTAAALVFGSNFAFAVGVFLLVCAALAPLVGKKARAAVAAALLAGALAMGGVVLQDILFVRPVKALADRTVYLEGRVTRVDYEDDSGRYLLDARIPLRDGGTLRTMVRVYSFTPLPTEINEELHGYVALYDPELGGKYKYAGMSSRLFLYGRFEERAQIVRQSGTARTPGYYITALREYLLRQNQRLLPPGDAALVNAVLFGEKGVLEQDVQLSFQRAGLAHLMAVSGFHLSLLVALAQGFLRMLGLSRRWSAAVTLPLMVAFMAISGFTPSVVRAGVMTGLCLVASLAGERYDALSALGLAMLALCAVNPFSALNTGFLLSFSATAGIIVLAPRIYAHLARRIPLLAGAGGRRGGGKALRALLQAFSVSAGAYLLTLPVMLFCFDSLSLTSPLASMVAMPLATAMLWCAAPTLIVSAVPFLFPVAAFLSLATMLFARLTSGAAQLFAAIPFAVLPVRYESVKALIVVFYGVAILLAALHAPKKAKRSCAFIGAVVIAAGWGSAWLFNRDTVQIATFDGMDAAVITAGDAATLVGFPQTQHQGDMVASYLQGLDIHKLDMAISTGLNNDSALGAVRVFEKIPPRRLLLPAQGAYTPHLLRAAADAYRGAPDPRAEMQFGTLGVRLTLIPCSCGRACKIEVGGENLLKCNENCAIMRVDQHTQGVIRGWTLVKRRADNGKMKTAFDGDRITTYTFRKQGGDGT